MIEDGAPWVRIERGGPRKTNVTDLLVPAMLEMPEELRQRWTAALNANQFTMKMSPRAVVRPDDDLHLDLELLLGDALVLRIEVRIGLEQRGLYASWRVGSKVLDAAAFRALLGVA